jgi:general secretion pathway protein H
MHATDRGGFTLLELVVTLGIVALAAGIVVPRLVGLRGMAVDVAARRLADALTLARDRAILGGRPVRLVIDLDGGRWTAPEDAATLPAGVRLRGVATGGRPAVREGAVTLELGPDGDTLPTRVDLRADDGRVASVVLPPAGARATVLR